MGTEETAYQNKDITSKVLAENFKDRTFRVYGLDHTVAIVDYESKYDPADKIKYLNYLTGIAGRYQKEKRNCPVLRMIVIYTGDISREEVSGEYDIGAVKINTEPAFLSELDADSIWKDWKAE